MTNPHYDNDYFVVRDHLDPFIASSIDLLAKKNNVRTILDVGCGSGRLVQFLKSKKYRAQGIDPSHDAIKAAKKIAGSSSIRQASASKLPFPANSFDMVTCISVIEHLTRKEGSLFLKEAKRVLTDKGIIYLITPNFATPIRYFQGDKWFGYSDPTHIVFYTPKQLEDLLLTHGFSEIITQFEYEKSIQFDWHLPGFMHTFPWRIKLFITYLMFRTPLALLSNSFRMAARVRK